MNYSSHGNSQVGKGAVASFKVRQIQRAPAQVSEASSSNEFVNAVIGERPSDGDKAWQLTLSGGRIEFSEP